MYKWQVKRRYNKIVEKLNTLTFPHPGIDTFKFTDWFKPVLDVTFEEIEIYWIPNKYPTDLDKLIFDNMDSTSRLACHRIKNDIDDIVNQITKSLAREVDRYCKYRKTYIEEPYLKNFKLYFDSCPEYASCWIEINPFTGMTYLEAVNKTFAKWDPQVLNDYRNYVKGILVNKAGDKPITGDVPSTSVWSFLSWHYRINLPTIEANKRTEKCQAFIDELEEYREANKKG